MTYVKYTLFGVSEIKFTKVIMKNCQDFYLKNNWFWQLITRFDWSPTAVCHNANTVLPKSRPKRAHVMDYLQWMNILGPVTMKGVKVHALCDVTVMPWRAASTWRVTWQSRDLVVLTCDLRGVLALAQSRAEQCDERAPEVLPGDAVESEVDAEVGVEQQVEVVLEYHYLAHRLRLYRLQSGKMNILSPYCNIA